MCFGSSGGILRAGSLETEGAECPQLDEGIQGTHHPMKRQEPEGSCIHRERNMRMAQHFEQEVLTSQELREALLTELNDEQLHTITGGCEACRGDSATISRSINRANNYRALSAISHHLELPDLAEHYSARANHNVDIVREVQARIDARHPEGYEPQKKRPRLE
jgi:hypothetical protein